MLIYAPLTMPISPQTILFQGKYRLNSMAQYIPTFFALSAAASLAISTNSTPIEEIICPAVPFYSLSTILRITVGLLVFLFTPLVGYLVYEFTLTRPIMDIVRRKENDGTRT